MHLQGVLDKIMCRAFPTMLKGPARVWFSKLTPNTIFTFKELSRHFITHPFYWRTEVQELFGKPTEHQAIGGRKLEILCNSIQQRGPADWRGRCQGFGYGFYQRAPIRRIYFFHLQEWPKDNDWHVIQGHQVYERWGCHDSLRGQTKEKGETRWLSSRQRKKVSLDEWMKGREKIKAPTQQDDWFHPTKYNA